MRYSIRVDYAIQKGRHGEKIEAMVNERDREGDAGGCWRGEGKENNGASRVSCEARQLRPGLNWRWGRSNPRPRVLTEYSVYKPT
jgi:hypothetical protein